jgi:hypothetical protein
VLLSNTILYTEVRTFVSKYVNQCSIGQILNLYFIFSNVNALSQIYIAEFRDTENVEGLKFHVKKIV